MFDRIKRAFGFETRALTLEQYPWLALPASAAGVSVSAETALRSPTTLAAVRVLTETIGSLPCHVYQRGEGNSRARDMAHPASELLAGEANPRTGAADLRMQLMRDALLHGAGYAQVIRTLGNPRELHRIDPRAVTVEVADTGEPSFKVRQKQGADRIFNFADILYIPTPGSTPDHHVKLIDLSREAIGIDLAMAQYQGRLFGNAARPSGILKVPKGTSPENMKTIRAAWQHAHGGDQTGKTAVLEADAEWQAISLTLVDSQFLELRRFVDMAVYDAAGGEPIDLDELEGRQCWLGVDMAQVNDLSAIVAVFRDADGGFTVLPWFFLPDATLRRRQERDGLPWLVWRDQGHVIATEGDVTDDRRVEDVIRECCERFRVQEVALDPVGCRPLINRLLDEGLPAVEHRQGFISMGPACSATEKAIIGGRFRHGGHPVLRWNFANIVTVTDDAGNIKFSKRRSPEKIDGAVAAAMAIGRASASEPASIYDQIGDDLEMLVL